MTTPSTEKKLHLIFEVSILLKGLLAFLEIIGGTLIFFIAKSEIISAITSLTSEDLNEEPKDFITQYLIKTVEGLSLTGQHFIALYLLSHGIVKFFIVMGLLRKKLWAYPSAVIVFSMFITYQLYRYTHTHSMWLLFLTILDLTIILLTINEYRQIKKHLKILP